ncbi:PaaI family thioesterase [soil metagenome]
MTPDLVAFLAQAFPQLDTAPFQVLEATADRLRLSFRATGEHLRPGDTVSGPTLMMLADTATYLLLVSRAGGWLENGAPNAAARSVTSALNISFLRRPRAGILVAEAILLKSGRRLAVTDVRIGPETGGAPYAQATVTYTYPDA